MSEGHDRFRAHPVDTSRVSRVWRENHIKPSTIRIYRNWVRRFYEYCGRRGLEPESQLTLRSVTRFVERQSQQRGITLSTTSCRVAQSALRAWSIALHALGRRIPCWSAPAARSTLPLLLRKYWHYSQQVRGIAVSTLTTETYHLLRFIAWLRLHHRPVCRLRIRDVDAFVIELRKHVRPRTVALSCGAIRNFVRFLYATGRIQNNIATSILAPPIHSWRRPPRALPWPAVRRIIRGIDRSTPHGKRDYALLLLMSTYGLGAAEALGLRLEDVDWRAGRLRIVRPKTGVETVLPLLPGLASALASYLQHGRPRHSRSEVIFVTICAPHQKLGSASAVRHLLIKHARAAGVTATFLGSHALRHSNACRQVDLGASPKVLGDILGHRSPASTSAYVRVALKHLRPIGLPVPR